MLCDSLSDFDNSPVLTEAAEQPLHLLYVVKKDLGIIVGFYKKDISPDGDEQAMLLGFSEMFLSFARSSKSQAFMVWLGDKPLLEVEVHNAAMHFPYEQFYTPGDNEYYMILNAGEFDLAEPAVYEKALRLCLSYFFRFPEVDSMIALANDGRYGTRQAALFTQAGMTRQLEITDPQQLGLYRISRPQ